VTVDEVNEASGRRHDGPLAGVLVHLKTHRVQRCRGLLASCISTRRSPWRWANLVKVLGWYDNEWGCTRRLVDLVTIIGGARG
jgi:glyceraldehyde 3-phosphate dehydrogenase